ncbi:MAG: hypothetical protein AB2L17_11695 [Lentimicrobium sp.]|jgi:hypothetical protein
MDVLPDNWFISKLLLYTYASAGFSMPEAVHQQHRFRTAICLQIKDENPGISVIDVLR